MKKLISILCLILALSLLCSCTKKDSDGSYDSAADFTKEEGEIYESVPDERYEGFAFRILNADVGSSASMMDAESIDGNNMNGRLFKRNSNVEERLGITVEELYDDPDMIFDTAVDAFLSGDPTYSAVCNTARHMATMAVCGYLVTDSALMGVDLTKPWWNEKATDSAAVDSARFFWFGDLQLSYYDAHSMVGVNMGLIDETDGLPDPYELVESGNWTLSRMLEMMRDSENDLDGNGILTHEDRFGVATDRESLFPLIIGTGTYISGRDQYGLPQMTCFTDEKLYDVFSLISSSLYENNSYVYNTEINSADGVSSASHFKSGKSLFFISNLGSLESLRDMEYEFGVLPMPKFAESQTQYVSFLSADDATAVGVLATGRNLLRTGNILENLAAESHRTGGLRDCYVDTVLSFRYVNDEKSRANLDLILEGGTFEPAEIYGWGGVCERLLAIADKKEVYASTLASVKLKALSDISDTVEEVNKHKG